MKVKKIAESTISKITKAKIKQILAWDLSQVRAYILKNEKIEPDDLDRRIEEYKKFIALHLVSEKRMPISEKVDLIWHTHILFTKDYVRMGLDVFGSYIHHEPTVSDSEKEALAPFYDDTLEEYNKLFGKPDAKYWPVKGQICWNPCNSSVGRSATIEARKDLIASI